MHAALHERLIAAQGDGLLDLLVELLARQDVGVGVAALAVEGAEVADGGADVGVVDVAVDVVGAIRLRMQPAADGVGGAAEGRQVAAVEQGDAFVEASAARRQRLCARCVAMVVFKVHSPRGPVPARRPACSNGAARPVRAAPGQSGGCWQGSGGRSRRPVPAAAPRAWAIGADRGPGRAAWPRCSAASTPPRSTPCAHRPDGVDERQAGPVVPLLAQVEGVGEARQAGPHGPVADQQHGVGVHVLGVAVQRQRHAPPAATP